MPNAVTTGFQWDKLSPAEFQQLQELTSYSSRKLQDVLNEFCEIKKQSPDGDIDYEGFKWFLDTFLEVSTPDELSRHLFLSFVRRDKRPALREMAAASSTAACAAVTAHGDHQGKLSLASKIHGLAERIQQLGRSSADSLDGEKGSRSRTGSVHPMFSVTTHPSYSSHELGIGRNETSPSHSQMSRNSSRKSSNSLRVNQSTKIEDFKNLIKRSSMVEVHTARVCLKDIVCYLSLLEAGRPEDKLEFMFRIYDTDGNGVLDTNEMDCIVNQMMTVAEYLGWETSELRPILQDMMVEIDYDADGTVSLDEWKRGGMTTIPLLVLLGLDTNVKEDGEHAWRLKQFNRPAYCNLCLNLLVGLGKKGLCCIFCKFTVHERCVQRAPASCIATYCKSRRAPTTLAHHWVEGNCHGKCARCRKKIKGYNGITGLHCRWCHITLHNRCVGSAGGACSLGRHAKHILPPTAIRPLVLDRQRSLPHRAPTDQQSIPVSISLPISISNVEDKTERPEHRSPPISFQITPPEGSNPLLVFINPKSGGRQGSRVLRKLQYILNPRQVHDIAKGGPMQGLQMFKDVKDYRVICCGGDGTVGWVLETMDKIEMTERPTVGVIPLGTGNDLARCLKWGGGYEGESIHKILDKISRATTVMMDRWQIQIENLNLDCEQVQMPEAKPHPTSVPYTIINNYFSIGVDAAICVKFHTERERNPDKFSSRMKNKLWYFEFATSEQFAASCKNLHENIDIVCDGSSLELSKGVALQGVALLNIPYAHGGSNLWGASARPRPARLSTAQQDIGDKLIEVIGLENCLHMGQVRTGLRASGRRLAQCSSVTITTKRTFPMQIDGEPWMQTPCKITITHKNQVPMLMGPPPQKGRGFFRLFTNC
ncbi:diacylglycerol kinase 1 [Leptidea sinapis]|uniref:diacylglycerol kinase 1 n=1 Tax=Leptidea sinapis TaxID=189913 RepID=UPI002137BEA6|nr:diacylglycerol kinase 1 [Leptidea sinapis]XP_050669176.1 diacylglycerol kinase 1 [Leptidea sinapis]XP_050669177.1 diacylglycerol kinase 1 [Leptidea sinapis]